MTDDLRCSTVPRLVIGGPGDAEPSESVEGHEQFARHADFWLEDGNLILLAGSTAFRVYRGILVKKSAVFADMFATGSSDATEMFDSCPVVRLPDHPDDLQDFLQYLMACSALNEVGNVPRCHFRELYAAIHLAHKYQCPDVEKRALFILKKYYTSCFAEFDVYDSFKTTLYPPEPCDAIAAVNIARLTDTPSILPYALYLTSLLEAQMVDGVTRRDGSVEQLSAEDLKLCIGARNELARELASVIYVFTLGPAAECRTRGECLEVWNFVVKEVERNALGEYNPLYPYSDCHYAWTEERGLCNACMVKMRHREREEQRRVWMRLPVIFGLTVEACDFTDGY